MTDEQKHSCGYPEGTFACKIRHLQINTGDAKSANDAGRPSAAARREGIDVITR